ncbi:hypothetical protein [Arcobacter sp. F2176]|uniref:hypothetical protein n=1 Tax=Arcobacter sp. F2176 TaxID=2044511 RepID=UPI00100AAF9E|nr:hypothetical protein [Arcobacter sp. F2176]RXJ82638.1 hypothetical protein CRU95_00815 [Arcobacter sp. F2176]
MSKVAFTKEQEAEIQLMMQQAVAQQNKELELKQAQRETNKIVLGARIQELISKEGSIIIDKSTNQPKTNVDGSPMRYPTRYYVKLETMGLELETEVKQDVFDSLEEFKMYLCEGRIGLVNKFGNDVLEPIFKIFTRI